MPVEIRGRTRGRRQSGGGPPQSKTSGSVLDRHSDVGLTISETEVSETALIGIRTRKNLRRHNFQGGHGGLPDVGIGILVRDFGQRGKNGFAVRWSVNRNQCER